MARKTILLSFRYSYFRALSSHLYIYSFIHFEFSSFFGYVLQLFIYILPDFPIHNINKRVNPIKPWGSFLPTANLTLNYF